jgi:hypothetical protein
MGRRNSKVGKLIHEKVSQATDELLTGVSGSYYVNPKYDSAKAPPALRAKFPEYTDPNVWPPANVLPGFRVAFEGLSGLIVDVGALVAKVMTPLHFLQSIVIFRRVMLTVYIY